MELEKVFRWSGNQQSRKSLNTGKMIVHNFVSSLTISLLIIMLFSCTAKNSLTFKVDTLDSSINAKKISISNLAVNYKKYQGQYIETTGEFCQAFEEFAIYTDKNLINRKAKGFWLRSSKYLNIDNSVFEKMNGKRVTIKGIIDTTSKGHLGYYLATIKEIYFWQQQ